MSIVPQAQTVGGGSGEWRTPPDLFARLDQRYRLGYDAFASHKNHVLPMYSTVEGTFNQQGWCSCSEPKWCASYGFMGDTDGLTHDWSGLRVFMNPPFTRGFIEQAVEKAYEEREHAAIIVALLPAATETRWFQRFVLPHCHIDWLPRRVRFINPETGKQGDSPTTGHVIAVFRSELLP